MKTADRENPNRWVTVPGTRVHGAEVQNRSRSTKWAGKQKKLRPREMYFFLTSPFIELLGTWPRGASRSTRAYFSLVLVSDGSKRGGAWSQGGKPFSLA